MASVKIGDPMEEDTELGPLSSADASTGLAKQVKRAVDAGATLYLGGKPMDRPGNFFEPTILTNVTRDNPAYFEEFFGSVAQIYVVKSDDEAVELANDSRFGLAGAVFSKNIERAKALASRIETDAIWINTFASTAPELPFGGVKRSGYGRELSQLGIKEFVNQKLVLVATPPDPGFQGPGAARPSIPSLRRSACPATAHKRRAPQRHSPKGTETTMTTQLLETLKSGGEPAIRSWRNRPYVTVSLTRPTRSDRAPKGAR
jgi:hypothetical protein